MKSRTAAYCVSVSKGGRRVRSGTASGETGTRALPAGGDRGYRLVTSTFTSWCVGQEIGNELCRLDHPLEIVQDQQQPLFPQHAGKALGEPTALVPHAQHGSHRRGDECRIIQHTQVDEPHPVRKGFQHVGGGLQRHARLAHATRTGDGQEPHVIAAKKIPDAGNLILPPDERRRLHGQVVGTGGQRPERREVRRQVGVQELEDPLRPVEIAQGMLAQITQARSCRERVPSEILRGQGEEHLTAVSSGQQARQPIQSGSEVVAILRRRCSGMQRHPHAYRSNTRGPRLVAQLPLAIEGC